MELGQTFSYIFEDKDWLKKLIPLAGLGLLSMIPVLGLLPAAASLGFLIQVAENVRQGLPRPLPAWKDFSKKFELGGILLLTIIAYHLPIILVSMCTTALINGLGRGFLGSTTGIAVLCCTLPMLIIYVFVIYPMIAIGVAEYIETGETGRFFQPLHQFDVLQHNPTLCMRWLLYVFLINIVTAFLVAIPCIGWLAIWLFAYPVQAHLLGQFAHRLSLSNKPQRKSMQRKPSP